jgi:hypothetical protein
MATHIRPRPVTRPVAIPRSSASTKPKINPANRNSGKARFKDLHKKLMDLSRDLPKPPAEFDPARQYRVKLKKVVTVPGTAHVLRPSHDVVVSGTFAATIADSIVGAAPV